MDEDKNGEKALLCPGAEKSAPKTEELLKSNQWYKDVENDKMTTALKMLVLVQVHVSYDPAGHT